MSWLVASRLDWKVHHQGNSSDSSDHSWWLACKCRQTWRSQRAMSKLWEFCDPNKPFLNLHRCFYMLIQLGNQHLFCNFYFFDTYWTDCRCGHWGMTYLHRTDSNDSHYLAKGHSTCLLDIQIRNRIQKDNSLKIEPLKVPQTILPRLLQVQTRCIKLLNS